MSTDHIIHDGDTGKFTCEICGVTEQPPFMPAPINVIVDAMDHFMSQHEACADPAPETVMSEYIAGFDAGYEYVLQEIERWIKQHDYEPRAIWPVERLLEHLRMESAKNRETT
jgi:hypothetical protein